MLAGPISRAPSSSAPASFRDSVIDFHQHLWPLELIEELEARVTAPFLQGEILVTAEGAFRVNREAHDLGRRIDELDRAGIDVAVISLQPTLGIDLLDPAERAALTDAYHAGIASLVAESGGRLRALSAGEVADGFDGVCVGASRLLDPLDLAEVLDNLDECGGTLFVHPDTIEPPPAGAPDWWQSVTEYTAEMQTAFFAWVEHGVARWPEVRVVFALLAGGAPFQFDRLQSRGVEVRRFTSVPVFMETSSYGRLPIELVLAAFGIERVVFGSDFPVIDPDVTLNAIRSLGETAFATISSRNAVGLLGRTALAV
jgi:6-methylsalicylate decarboxylase